MSATIHDLIASRAKLKAAIAKRRARAYQPPPRMTLDEWADTYRIVPTESSAIAGPWKTANMEIARGPMRFLSDPRVRALDMMAGAQLLKTTVMEINAGYRMHLDPGTMIFYSSSQDTIDATVQQKIDPMIVNTPQLAALWGGARALEVKSDKFTRSFKKFPGGSLQLLTMNSTANMRNRSARDILIDELDDCQATVDGDSYDLAASRASMHKGKERVIAGSTPTVRGQSAIEARYLGGDQRRALVECPACGDWDYFRWPQVKFRDENDKIKPDLAHYRCPSCEHRWTAAERVKRLTTKDGIFWAQTKAFSCCDELQEPLIEKLWDRKWNHDLPAEMGRAMCKHCGEKPVSVERSSVTASILYNPQWTIPDIVRLFLDCNGDPQKIRVFVNNRLGETWEDRRNQLAEIDLDQFTARSEAPWDVIPEAVKVLTMGVDVQPQDTESPGRLEAEIVGWADGEETWSVAYHVIIGNPDHGEVWSLLDDIRKKIYETEDGRKLYIQATAIDTGGRNMDSVMAYAGARTAARVWAIKGASETGIGSRSPIWPLVAPSTFRHGAKLFVIGTLAAKDWVLSCASRSQPGPGFMHVPADRSDSWYKQMLSERRVIKESKGRTGSTWVERTSGARTEALDCRVYAKAAFEGLKKAVPKLSKMIQSAPAAAIATTKPDAATESHDEKPETQSLSQRAAAVGPRRVVKPMRRY